MDPRCGGCKCGNCPIPGQKYSFKEQQEFDCIQNNLFYVPEQKRWFTKLPWITERNALSRNERSAYQSVITTERRCLKDPELAKAFPNQIQAMVDRGAAIEISEEELQSWKGDYHYLMPLGVKGKGSKAGELLVVFDASRKHGKFLRSFWEV